MFKKLLRWMFPEKPYLRILLCVETAYGKEIFPFQFFRSQSPKMEEMERLSKALWIRDFNGKMNWWTNISYIYEGKSVDLQGIAPKVENSYKMGEYDCYMVAHETSTVNML